MYSSTISSYEIEKSLGVIIPINFNLFLDSKLSFSIILPPILGGDDGLPDKNRD